MIGYDAKNVDFVAYHDLDGRPCFKMAIHVVGDKWYMYLTNFWQSAWTIMDITDPFNPIKIKEIEGPQNTWTINLQIARGLMITSLEEISPAFGGVPGAKFEEGIQLWDLSNPIKPKEISRWKTGDRGTHRNYYDGDRYVHLTARMPGFAGYIYVILDIIDKKNPTEVGRFFLPEQYEAGGGVPRSSRYNGLHGPAYVDGDRAYMGYGSAGFIIADISDVKNPRLVSHMHFGNALGSSLGAHTMLPIRARGLALINTEAIAEESNEPLNYTAVVDISEETRPKVISMFPIPEPPEGASYSNFSKRGGRFGPHNFHHYQNQPCLMNSSTLVFMANFNAGFRVYDISDPYIPREVGFFLPHDPTVKTGLLPRGKLVTQSEDVLVDSRGYAYFTDKNHGLFVVRYNGI